MPDALTQPFIDRREGGAVLAQQLRHYASKSNVVVLALPRGGVPVAYEVATVLGVRLDVFVVCKLGVPGQPELAMGAIAPGGRRGQPPVDLRGQVVIIVDDGLATGSTMQAAVKAGRQLGAARVVVAAPVGAAEACRSFLTIADEVICARQPARFNAVGHWYHNFSETTDAEVDELLNRARQALAAMQP